MIPLRQSVGEDATVGHLHVYCSKQLKLLVYLTGPIGVLHPRGLQFITFKLHEASLCIANLLALDVNPTPSALST